MFSLFAYLCDLLYFALHVTGTGSFPRPLTAKEERECLEQIALGDEAAKARLIEHNLRLVAHIIKKYYSTFKDQDDLISIGTIGLIKAVSTFKPEKSVRFATYASRCIENEVLMHFRNKKKSAQDVYISDPIDTDKDGNSLTLMDVMTAYQLGAALPVYWYSAGRARTPDHCDAIWAGGEPSAHPAGGCKKTGYLPFVRFTH